LLVGQFCLGKVSAERVGTLLLFVGDTFLLSRFSFLRQVLSDAEV
jgi:hypothetical protein